MSESAPSSVAPAGSCPDCGGAVPSDAPRVGGLAACPRCLLGVGIPTGARLAAAAAAEPPRAAEVAARFPDHEILGLLGRGGMGVVWKARQRTLDRVVALKVLPREVAGVPGFAERFQREARALARLAHPNIVGVHEFGERDGCFYLVLEYVEGVNMRQALREGRIAPRDALRIVPQICDALQYAHEHGVVHRDIKPENVLIDADGRVKVTDFGIAKIVAAGEGPDGRPELTLTGQVMGTPHYMAPEQWERPTTVDHRADIYSLGVVFYEMLTGELPLGRFQPPSEMVRVDVRIDEVVLRSLEKAPDRRWQRADDVRSEMDDIASTPVRYRPPLRASDVPRLSALAVYGAAGPFAAASLFLIAFGLHRFAKVSVPSGPVLVVTTLVAAAAWIASIVAWVRIGRSRGRLRGRAFAVAGVFAPIAVLGVVAIGGLSTRRATIAVVSNLPPVRMPDGSVVTIPGQAPVTIRTATRPTPRPASDLLDADKALAEVRALWPQLLRAGARLELTDVEDLYTPATRDELRDIPASSRRQLADAGQLGLPLTPDEFLGAPLSSFFVADVRVDAKSRTAVGVARTPDGSRTVEFDLTCRGVPRWHFTSEPVRTLPGARPLLRPAAPR